MTITNDQLLFGAKTLGLVVLIFAGIWAIFFTVKGLHYLLTLFPEKPPTPYDYKPEELWEPPPYWQKNEPVQHNIVINEHGDDDWPHTENHV